jgi:hypothetical protein
MGCAQDLFERDEKQIEKTPCGVEKGLNVYTISKAIIEAFDEITQYEILAAWLVTGNLTLQEALQGMAALGSALRNSALRARSLQRKTEKFLLLSDPQCRLRSAR